CARSWTWFAYW
nr:immunoglobulin heavy chain junction region [Mus musculus]MBK4188531.1 immunoglobulin heavy chain junction region [Mus musculus]MBK4190040.1 immunoglobulin heavy chain junction region [Mus musculus]